LFVPHRRGDAAAEKKKAGQQVPRVFHGTSLSTDEAGVIFPDASPAG
jgi:hypothetical protein